MAFSLRAHRSRSWIERALDALALDERFIFYWIALNALYGRPKYLERGPHRTPEIADLEAFLRNVSVTASPSQLKTVSSHGEKLLSNRFLHEGTWKWDSDEAAARVRREYAVACRELAEGQVRNYLIVLFRRLYVLRKQMFHGCATFESKANRDTVEPAVAVLSVLVPLLCEAVELRGEVSLGLGDPPFKPDERWTRGPGDRSVRKVQHGSSRAERPSLGIGGLMPNQDGPISHEAPAPDSDRWSELCARIEKCHDCIALAPHAVTKPLKRGEVPDPPSRTRILFIGVAPTAQKRLNGGSHFYSSSTDALRTGLFHVLDRIFGSDLVEANNRSLSKGTRRFIDLGHFFLHAGKVRPFYDDAPPPDVLRRCASVHLGPEIGLLAPRAVCLLGKNNLGVVARELFGTDLVDGIGDVSIGAWRGSAAIAPQPIRGWDDRTERIIRELDLVASRGGL